MYKVLAMGGREFCAGFALAGIDTLRVTESSAKEVFARMLLRDDLSNLRHAAT